MSILCVVFDSERKMQMLCAINSEEKTFTVSLLYVAVDKVGKEDTCEKLPSSVNYVGENISLIQRIFMLVQRERERERERERDMNDTFVLETFHPFVHRVSYRARKQVSESIFVLYSWSSVSHSIALWYAILM